MSLPKFEFILQDVMNEKHISQDEITEVRQWMPTANLPLISDEMIVTFIIACRRDVDNTKRALIAYFTFKNNSPEIFNDRDIDSEELSFTSNVVFVKNNEKLIYGLTYTENNITKFVHLIYSEENKKLTQYSLQKICIFFAMRYHASMPVETDDECVVHMFKLNDTKYYNFHFNAVAKLCFMLVDISLNRKSPPNGLKVVIDAKGAGLMYLTRMKLKTLKKLVEYLQEAMPMNMKEIHVLNTILLVDKIIFMLKPFMKPELYKMLHLHPNNTNMEEFSQNHIPKKCLPSDYGGDLPSFEELNQKTIERYRELKFFFEIEERIRKEWSQSMNQ